MNETGTDQEIKFDIHASIVFKLGEDLITDEIQALVELIKNAYDADAGYAKVIIRTSGKNDFENTRYPNANGCIQITDNGHGIDKTAIVRGWLTVSNSLKREMKSQKKITGKGRTPLGDKGLGRLGCQRLGENVEIFSKPENEDCEYHVSFSWKDFEKVESLSKVPVYFNESQKKKKKGTTILISGIKNPESLAHKDYKEKLQNELSLMISPYKEIKDFTVLVSIDDKEVDLTEISENVLDSSQVRYFIEFDEKKLTIAGQARLNYFLPGEKENQDLFKRLVEADNGEAFFHYLSNQKSAPAYNLARSTKPGWYIEYRQEIAFDEIDKIEKKANPGRFKGRVDSFYLKLDDGKQPSAFDTVSDYKKYIKDLSGIRVYRDGFGIRVDGDWLGLGHQSTSGTSYYGLRIQNVLGYIALSARENSNLEETTDREGFVVNRYYENFYKILKEFITFAEKAPTFVRRGWHKYRDLQDEKIAKVKGPASTPEQLSKKIKASTAKANSFKEPVKDIKDSLYRQSDKAQRLIADLSGKSNGSPRDIKRLTASIRELTNTVNDALGIISKLQGYLDELENLGHVETVLDNQIKLLREQLEQIYEAVSLGLTAEALSHEILNVADRFEKQIGEYRSFLKKQEKKDAKTVTFVENMRTGVNALRKQISHLAPSLKYVREKKEHIDLLSFCRRDVAAHHNGSSAGKKITVNVKTSGNGNFSVYMNRGKLIQVFDNLIQNSRYWLYEDIRMGFINQGLITIIIEGPFVRVTDNGRGILPLVESSLFEPFISTKTRGEGRGLGLFIVQQLLDSEGCTISLLPERNSHDRRYIFEINFSGRSDEH